MSEAEELAILRKALNERAKVEQEMWQVVSGKKPVPSVEQVKDWAIRLGVPEEFRE